MVSNSISFTEKEKRFLLGYVRSVIANELGISKSVTIVVSNKFQEKAAAFVTLHLDGQLRGCIGYVEARESLLDTLKSLAISAAFKDTRFSPLTLYELPKIDIEISVLSPLVLVDDIADIVIGRDGLLLKSGFKSGVFLPQVPVEQGWDKNQYLAGLCQKAGVPAGSWQSAQLYKFSATVFGEKIKKL